MNYFTPTQQRIAMVETASYNQKLLALRARRLAQQRMDFAHTIATMNQEDDNDTVRKQQSNEKTTTSHLGNPPQITEESDDEEYELDEIFAPVPYQKGYWLAAQRQKSNAQKRQQSTTNKPETNNNLNRSQYRYKPYKPYAARGPARKKPEYRPAVQHHPSFQRRSNKPGGPPALV
eukprot:681487_1